MVRKKDIAHSHGGILYRHFSRRIRQQHQFMLAALAAQGVGMSMFPIAFGIIREILPEKKLAIGQTIFSSTFSGGAVVGLIVGATIIQNFGWQATFFSIFPIAVILGLVIRRFIHVRNLVTSEGKVKEGGQGEEVRNEKIFFFCQEADDRFKRDSSPGCYDNFISSWHFLLGRQYQ